METSVERRQSSPAFTNLVSWVWVELAGGLSLSCQGVKCGWTVHTPAESREAGRPELKEATTVMKGAQALRRRSHRQTTAAGGDISQVQSTSFRTSPGQDTLPYAGRSQRGQRGPDWGGPSPARPGPVRQADGKHTKQKG